MFPTLRSVSSLPLPVLYWAAGLFLIDFYKLFIYTIDLTIYEFQIGEFTPLLKVFCNPQINTQHAFVFIHRYAQRGEKSVTQYAQLRSSKAVPCLLVSAPIL